MEDIGSSIERAARHLRQREQRAEGRVSARQAGPSTQLQAAKDSGKYGSLGRENDAPECTGLSWQGNGERLAVADSSYEEPWRRVPGHCCWAIPIALASGARCRVVELGGVREVSEVKERC